MVNASDIILEEQTVLGTNETQFNVNWVWPDNEGPETHYFFINVANGTNSLIFENVTCDVNTTTCDHILHFDLQDEESFQYMDGPFHVHILACESSNTDCISPLAQSNEETYVLAYPAPEVKENGMYNTANSLHIELEERTGFEGEYQATTYSKDDTMETNFAAKENIVIEDLKSGTAYIVSIKTVTLTIPGNLTIFSTDATEVNVITAPIAMENGSISVSESSIALEWDNPNGNATAETNIERDGEKVYYGERTDAFVDAPSIGNKLYTYEIYAITTDGQESAVLVLNATSAPGRPKVLTQGPETNTTITITWMSNSTDGDASDTYDYFVEISKDGVVHDTVSTDQETWEFSNLEPNMEYEVRVRASNGVNSTWSEVELVYTKPNLVEGFTYTATMNNVIVEWNDVGATVYETTINDNEMEQHTDNYRTFENLAPGGIYVVKIVAIGYTTELNSTFVGNVETVPTAPTDLSIDSYNGVSANISWSAPTSNASTPADIQYTIVMDGKDPIDTTGQSQTLNDLQAGTEYTAYVSASTNGGKSDNASIVFATRPEPPQDIHQTSTSNDSITVTFSESTTSSGTEFLYNITYTKQNGEEEAIPVADVICAEMTCSANMTSLDANTNYSVIIVVKIKNHESVESKASNPVFVHTLPNPPQNIDVSSITNDSFVVSWQAPGGDLPIVHYEIRLNTDTDWIEVNSSVLSYTFVDQTPSQNYTVELRTINNQGPSEIAQEVNIETLPSPVTGLEASTPSDSLYDARYSIKLAWTSPLFGDLGISYVIHYGEVGNGFSLDQTINDEGVTSVVIEGLAAETEYEFKIITKTDDKESDDSEIVKFTTADATSPDASPASVTAESDGRYAIIATWSSISKEDNGGTPVTGYVIQYMAKDSREWTTRNVSGIDTLSYGILELRAEQTYEIRVAAENEKGTGNFSVSVEATTDKAVAPFAPTISLVNTTRDHVCVIWEDPEDDGGRPIDEYVLKWDWKVNDTLDSSNETVPNTIQEYCIEGLIAEMNYNISVTAINTIGTGIFSDKLVVTTNNAVKPTGSPSNLRSEESDITPYSIKISWDELLAEENGGAAIDSYTVYYGTNESKPDEHKVTNLESATMDNLTPNTTYYFAVAAKNIVGEGPKSEPISVQTTVLVPDAPADLIVKSTTFHTITVTWKAPLENGGSPVTGYKIEWDPPTADSPLLVSSTEEKEAIIDSLTIDTGYSISVFAINDVGHSKTGISTTASTNPAELPSEPTNLQASSRTHNSINVEWNEPEHPGGVQTDEYQVFYRDMTDDASSHNVTLTTLSATLDSLSVGTSYNVSVRARNSVGYSDESSFEIFSTLNVPAAPYSLTQGEVTSTSISISWTAPTSEDRVAATSYKVSYAVQDEPVITEKEFSSTSITLKDLTPETAYVLNIHSFNKEANLESETSASTVITTLAGSGGDGDGDDGEVDQTNTGLIVGVSVAGGAAVGLVVLLVVAVAIAIVVGLVVIKMKSSRVAALKVNDGGVGMYGTSIELDEMLDV